MDEPLSPTARLFHDMCIVTTIGLAKPIELDAFRAGIEATLLRHPRFSSIRVIDPPGSTPRWVRTLVNIDNHLIIPDLQRADVSADPDKVLEDYMASLSTLPMDYSRPLWEVHLLDFPTSEAASTIALRFHHALGDGTSLISLFIACTRSASDSTALPAMPPPPTHRRSPIYALPQDRRPLGVLANAAWILSHYIMLVWHTVVDVACFLALLFACDKQTVFKGVKGVEFRRKRFISRSLSLGDVKHIKNTLGCTVNDVLLEVSSAALSRYYFQKLRDEAAKHDLCITSLLVVNMRETPGVNEVAKMMESDEKNDVKWGNKLGYILLPFHIHEHNDPLEYVIKAKKVADRKKHSLEAIFTRFITEVTTKCFSIKVSGALFHRMVSSTTTLFSNVIGPIEQVELYGHPVLYIAPSVCGHPSALTIHWQSYAETIRIILAVDDTQFPDSHQLLDEFAESLNIIREATSRLT